MGRKSDVRQRVIDVASELFWHQGYETTGVAEILEKAGIGSGSLYWFFKTKEDLLRAVLESYRQRLETDIREPAFRRCKDPVERVFCVLDVYRRILIETEFRRGCPAGNIILELGNTRPRVRQKAEGLFRAWREMVGKCLRDAAGRFPPGTDLEALSVFALTIMEGAVMQARAHRQIAYFDESVDGLRKYIELLMKQSARSGRGAEKGPGRAAKGRVRGKQNGRAESGGVT